MNTIIFIFSLLLFITPGILITTPLMRKNRIWQHPEFIFIGCVVGMLLSCLVASLVGLSLDFNTTLISISLATISILIALYKILQFLNAKNRGFNSKINKHYEKWDKQDYGILFSFLILVLLLAMIPQLNIGRETEYGLAYTYLIDNDFLQHSAIASEITKGIPPQNIYFSGEVFQYHWLSHVFPSFIYSLSDRSFTARDILIWVLRFYTTLFVCMLFSLIRLFFKDRKVQILLMILALFAYSYNGIYALSKPLLQSLGNTFTWINSIAYFSDISNGYFRDFIVEPHSLLALSSIFTVLFILQDCSYIPRNKQESVLLGILFGIMPGVEGFIGITMILWLCVTFFYIIYKHRTSNNGIFRYKELIPGYAISMFVMLIAISALFLLGIFTAKTNILLLRPYKIIILLLPIYSLVEYGPFFVLALGGISLCIKKKIKNELSPIFLLCMLSLFLILFVRHFAEPNHVLRKSGKVMQISLLIFSGVCLDYYIVNKLKAFKIVLTLVIAIGAITTIIDIYRFSNIYDTSKTTYVRPSDYKACEWIKDNTPLDAVIQSKPGYISTNDPTEPYFEYSLISMFAERRMAVGDSLHASIYQIGQEKQSKREKEINEIFKTFDIDRSIQLIRKYGIDYIYVGITELEMYGVGVLKFATAQNYFEKVYSKNDVNIYRFNSGQK
ncbi:MAG: hypothetical protein ACUVWN_07540 [bacterium]